MRSIPTANIHPWRRPGAVVYGLRRFRGILRPPVTVTEPPAGLSVVDLDTAVPVRDGTVLRVNVFRPAGPGPFPTIMSAHPYGKDRLPSRRRGRSQFSPQYRIMGQPTPVQFSTWTSWEAPDPGWWVARGYAVINADLRGGGTAQGVGALMSDGEAQDYYDLIEWAGCQGWSNGRVGLLGVSYLAMSQYKVAALNPPSLRAICPWEGMTDAYRDLMQPGGVTERGFTVIWSTLTGRAARVRGNIAHEQADRPLRDSWWRSLVPDLGKIETPMMVCASFSDNNMHSRGSFRAFEQVASTDKFAYTHRGGKWSTFYAEPARRAQLAFFDRYLQDMPGDPIPPVRLEVRESRTIVAEVRSEMEWPLARTHWQPLYLAAAGRLSHGRPEQAGQISFRTRRNGVAFDLELPDDTEFTGPMALRLWISVDAGTDVNIFAGVEKWCGQRYIGFEGSYGFGRDRVATGWQKASLRELDHELSTPAEPVHTFLRAQPLEPGVIVPVDIALGPSATLFRRGDTLRLVVAGRWLWPANPLTGQFPARYRRSPAAHCTVHWGPDHPAQLLVPRIPRESASTSSV